MSAPTNTVRGTPAGIKLKDGYQSTITFAANSTISFWEKEITPPGLDGGEKVPQTTLLNNTFRTFASRGLYELSDVTVKAAYDPIIYSNVASIINVEGSISVKWKDGSTLDFFGYLQKFMPDALADGTQPEASITIVCTNWDPVGKVEAGPVLTNVAGT